MICGLAHDIVAFVEEGQELEGLDESLDNTRTRYIIKISNEKTKLTTNSAKVMRREIQLQDRRLEQLQASSTL